MLMIVVRVSVTAGHVKRVVMVMMMLMMMLMMLMRMAMTVMN